MKQRGTKTRKPVELDPSKMEPSSDTAPFATSNTSKLNVPRDDILAEPIHLQRLALRMNDAALCSGLSRGSLYKAINSGALKSYRCGGRRLILTADLLTFITGNSGG